MTLRALLAALVALVALVAPGAASAGAGELDRTWAGDGTVHTPGLGDYVDPASVAVQPDGKVVAVGSAATSAGPGSLWPHQIVVVRYQPDGALDTTFSGDGILKIDIPGTVADDVANDVAIARDGKIVVGATGYDQLFPSFRAYSVVLRFLPNGTPDTSFGGDGVVHSEGPPPCPLYPCSRRGSVASVHVQPDGKTVVVGDSWAGVTVFRLLADGTPDTTFDGDGYAVLENVCCQSGPGALQADGKILVSGSFGIVRLLSTGAPDPGFGSSGLLANPEGYLARFAVAPDGSVVTATSDGCGSSCTTYLRRWTTAGQPDTGWGSGGVVTMTAPTPVHVDGLAFDAAGRLLVRGTRTAAPQHFLRRLTASGAPDANFAPGGEVALPAFQLGPRSYPAANAGPGRMVVRPDGKLLVVGGDSTAAGMQFTRFLLDTTPARLAGPIACNATSIGSGPPTVYGGDPVNAQYVVWRSDFYRYASGSWTLSHSAPSLVSAATKTSPATQWYDLNTGQPVSSQSYTTVPPGGGWLVAQLMVWYTLQGQFVTYAYDVAPWVSGANAFAPLCYWP